LPCCDWCCLRVYIDDTSKPAAAEVRAARDGLPTLRQSSPLRGNGNRPTVLSRRGRRFNDATGCQRLGSV
ncbi:hypothetical protein D918_05420, partial [Trichuris suis]